MDCRQDGGLNRIYTNEDGGLNRIYTNEDGGLNRIYTNDVRLRGLKKTT